tara:strand:- start:95 stop:472 length:378 start_codon:yes stop_codon:yes gene_type:complete
MSKNFIIKNFFEGKIKLWKSFWLIGIGHSIFLFYLMPFIEKNLFNKDNIYNYINIEQSTLAVPNWIELSFFSRIIVILSTMFITIGIWRSAENYQGSIIWIILSFIYLTINNVLPTIYLLMYLFV